MDERILGLVVIALGAVACLCVGGIVIASAQGHEPSPALATITSTAVGGLLGLLVVPRPPAGGAPATPPAPAH